MRIKFLSVAVMVWLASVSCLDAAVLAGSWTSLDTPWLTNHTMFFGISGDNIVGGSWYRNDAFVYNMKTKVWTSLNTHTRGAVSIDGDNVLCNSDSACSLYNLATQTWTSIYIPVYSLIANISGDYVVGTYGGGNSDVYHGYFYNIKTAAWTPLNMPGEGCTMARCMNGNRVAGSYCCCGTFFYDITSNVWSSNTQYPEPSGISGDNIVGYSDDIFGYHGYIYNMVTGKFTKLLAPAPGQYTIACGISGDKVVGYYCSNNGNHGFIYTIPSTDVASPIQITSVPRYGLSGSVTGIATDLTPASVTNYEVMVFINAGGKWWTKPYTNGPATKISRSGSWTTKVVTSVNDKYATEIRAYLAPKGQLFACAGSLELPSALSQYPFAHIVRLPAPTALRKITITPKSFNLKVGGASETLVAVGSDRYKKPVDASFSWLSTNPRVAVVDQNGIVWPVARGSATVLAISGLITGSAPIRVTAP